MINSHTYTKHVKLVVASVSVLDSLSNGRPNSQSVVTSTKKDLKKFDSCIYNTLISASNLKFIIENETTMENPTQILI